MKVETGEMDCGSSTKLELTTVADCQSSRHQLMTSIVSGSQKCSLIASNASVLVLGLLFFTIRPIAATSNFVFTLHYSTNLWYAKYNKMSYGEMHCLFKKRLNKCVFKCFFKVELSSMS